MKLCNTTSIVALTAGLLAASAAAAADAPAAPRDEGVTLEQVTVTAQKREETVQNAPISVSALSGATLAKDKILTLDDLGHSVTGISFTANSPQSNEINIRGVVNTRLSAPTADQSVSTFVDEVYVSRSGNLNSAFYDVARVEVVRGPQGVLLGKNVAGGAINVISAAPEFETSGKITATYGNYDLHQFNGYVTGPINDEWAARLSFQTINHSGYARDLEHNVDLENLNSTQFRGQVLYRPKDSDLRASLILDYSKDDSNGPNRVAVPDPNLTGTRPWSTARAQIAALRGGLSVRESFPTWPLFAGDASPTPQGVHHETWSGILKIEKDVIPDVRFTSITGVREGRAATLYDQSGLGPTNPYNIITTLLFAEPVDFIEQAHQISQEVRLTSNYTESRFDWIVGAYYQKVRVHQFNRFWGETPFQPGGRAPGALAVLSGESHWDDHGHNEDKAVFAQLGFKFTDTLKLEVGARYTQDEKGGFQSGVAIRTGDRFVPTDPTPLTPLTVSSFATAYDQKWNKLTPQATLTWKPTPDMMAYATVSVGFKGGGFQNDAPNAVAAALPYNPETVTNYELGYKLEFLDHRARWNTSVFYMDYKDLQVQQTSAACLCNIINNASSATIKGIETDVQFAPTHWLRTWASGNWLDAEYNTFIDTNGVNNQGHFLQRTPKWQAAVGAEATTDLFSWPDALTARVSYRYQAKMFWAPDNLNWENGYGLLDARITLTPPGKSWNVSIYGKNLTDKLYKTNIISFFGDQVASFGAPRTFGIELTAGF